MARKNERLYRIWIGIQFRVRTKNLEMSETWLNNYQGFKDWSLANGYTESTNLYRVDTTVGYLVSNCKWVEYVALVRQKADKRKKSKCKNKECNNYTARKNSHCRTCSGLLRRVSDMDRTEYARNWSLSRKYNISLADFNKMLEFQKGKCAICGKDLELPTLTRGQGLDTATVDHCHTTSKVRAILCSACNKGLGLFNDSIMILTNAVNYLRRHNG